MKIFFRTIILFIIVFTMNSCSSDTLVGSETGSSTPELIASYTYNESELEMIQLINDYRVSVGLNTLEKSNHISYKSEEHDLYMIANKTVNHNDFVARSENIIAVLGAQKVGENVAYNYKTSQAALKAWLESPDHKKNIEGDYTHFGIAIKIDAETGKKYYTNIFAKI